MADPPSPMRDAERARARARLKGGALGGLLLLAAMNAVGIYLNLYVVLRDTTGYSGVFSAMFASAAGVLHVALAVLLFTGGLVMIVPARRSGDPRLLALAVGAFASFLVAAYSGYHFVAANDSAYSLSMELGFLGAVLCQGGTLALVGGPLGTDPTRGSPAARAAAP